MEKIFNFFSMVVGGVGGVLLYLFDCFDVTLKSLVVLIVLDWITGLLKAVYEKKVSSVTGFKGIIKKIFILIVVVATVTLQKIINVPVREVTIMFFLANEAISLLENISTVVPVPHILKVVLVQLRENNVSKIVGDEDNEKDSN